MKNRRIFLLIAGLALLILAGVVVMRHPAGPTVKSGGDLATAQGQIISYTFLDDSRGTHQYMIHLTGYKATFQIPADFADHFAKARFESDLKKGDFLSVSILSQNAGKLISDGPVPIFGARSKSATYLDEYDTLNAYNNKTNGHDNDQKDSHNATHKEFPALTVFVYPLLGLIFIVFLIGLAITISRRKRLAQPDTVIDESAQRLKKCLTKRAAKQKSTEVVQEQKSLSAVPERKLLTIGDPEQKSIEPTTCPICGAPAEKAYVYGPESTLTQGTAGETVSEKNITAANGKSETAGSHGASSRPCAGVLRCSSCKRIILEYGSHDSDTKPSPRQLAWEPETK